MRGGGLGSIVTGGRGGSGLAVCAIFVACGDGMVEGSPVDGAPEAIPRGSAPNPALARGVPTEGGFGSAGVADAIVGTAGGGSSRGGEGSAVALRVQT